MLSQKYVLHCFLVYTLEYLHSKAYTLRNVLRIINIVSETLCALEALYYFIFSSLYHLFPHLCIVLFFYLYIILFFIFV